MQFTIIVLLVVDSEYMEFPLKIVLIVYVPSFSFMFNVAFPFLSVFRL